MKKSYAFLFFLLCLFAIVRLAAKKLKMNNLEQRQNYYLMLSRFL